MIVSDLFEEIPIASGAGNQATPPASTKKVASNFTQTSESIDKMPGAPSTPTVPNMTQAPAKITAPAYAEIMKNAPAVAEPVQDFSGQKAAEQIAVKDITNQVSRQMKLVKTKDDLKKIKQLIDRQFTRHGLVSESAFAKRDILVKRADAKLARILK